MLNFLLLLPSSCFATEVLNPLIFTDAHEGLVYVAEQDRLYFTTKPQLKNGKHLVAIHYLDLKQNKIVGFIDDANMANSMTLANDGQALLVAEQGSRDTPAAISEINLTTKKRRVLTNNFAGKPFNSPNKIIQNKTGLIYFSDPDYGYNQGFKAKPQLKNAIYVFDSTLNKTILLTNAFKMPHGLALTDDDNTLLVGDTAANDSIHPYDPTKSHGIYRVILADATHIQTIVPFITIPNGIPDGIIVHKKEIYTATAHGILHYDAQGQLLQRYSTPVEAFSLSWASDINTLFVTTNTAIHSMKTKSS